MNPLSYVIKDAGWMMKELDKIKSRKHWFIVMFETLYLNSREVPSYIGRIKL